jgi:hypothetical protein
VRLRQLGQLPHLSSRPTNRRLVSDFFGAIGYLIGSVLIDLAETIQHPSADVIVPFPTRFVGSALKYRLHDEHV